MANNKVLKLSKKYESYLENLPEQGMGYQLVDVKLKNGKILLERVVFNSSLLKLEDSEDLKNEDIEEISLATL